MIEVNNGVRRAIGAMIVMIASIPLALMYVIASGIPTNPLELASWLYNILVLMVIDSLVGGALLAAGTHLLDDVV